MGQFKYKVADSAGKVWVQDIDADSEDDALLKLRTRHYTVLKRIYVNESAWNVFREGGLRRKKFDVCEFTGKLVPLLQSHVQLPRALQIIYDGSSNPEERKVVENLRRGLHEGKRFSQLLKKEKKLFPVIYSSMAEVGEESGELTNVLEEVYKFLKDGRDLRDFLVTSSIYPGVLLSVTVLVILAIFVFFLPFFADIFTDMGRELPGATKFLLGISGVIIDYWWLWFISIGGGIWYLRRAYADPEKRLKIQGFILRLPLVGELIIKSQMSRFFRTLAILFQSQVQLLTSIRIAVGTITNEVISNSFAQLPADLRGGGKLSAGMKKSQFVDNETVQLIELGEESGEVGEMLGRVAMAQEERLKVQIKRLLALFEPVVLVLLALVILVVVLTVFLTILEMNEF